jgi:aminopeptidase N
MVAVGANCAGLRQHPLTPGSKAVPGENLTRLEAQERRDVIDTQSYEVSLDLTKGAEVFGSRSVVRFTATPDASTFIDLIAREVREISLNGEQLDPDEVFADSRISLTGLQP